MSSTINLLTFQQALQVAGSDPKPHLLLGNGFSIACRPGIFVYGKLFERAKFSKLSPSARKAFDALETTDFEVVIKSLRQSTRLLTVYKDVPGDVLVRMAKDADGLRELLVETIASSHPNHPGEITELEYQKCRDFLANFKTVYTLNYDLLLYWAQMHVQSHETPTSDDGFRKPEDDFESSYVVWEPHQSHDQNTWYLHGALHVFDAGAEVQKYTWVNTGIRLIDQIRDALSRNYFPLFVSEGTSEEKVIRIRHSDYLAKAYRSFTEIGGTLFIYGHSLAENDEHYLKKIEQGKLTKLFVGLHGDPDSPSNKKIIRRALSMPNKRRSKKGLGVHFYGTESASVWR